MVKLNMSLNHTVVVVCPLCNAKHERTIESGRILDRGKQGNYKEEICPPKSACSKTPSTKKMQDRYTGKRDGQVIESSDDLVARESNSFLRELWIEKYGGN